uniref:Tubulin_C domain-containing protein n=1 Tax=Bursaphelenchus xylophilus TaxID=6326 RepID=A0A1I7RYN7_BURXY
MIHAPKIFLVQNKPASKIFFLGIIEDVILLGAPVSASTKQWKQLCTVVGGRVVNGYCTTDWLLRFLYRTMSVQFTIAGTGPVAVKEERKIVNVNLSHIIKGHMDYSKKLTEVLEAVGVRVSEYSKESKENLEQYFDQRDGAGLDEKQKKMANEMVTCSIENGREVARNMEGKVVFRQEPENGNEGKKVPGINGKTNGIQEFFSDK